MMLQCKLSILLSFSFLAALAQGNDTSVFFRHAATFDNLLPVAYAPLNKYLPDSSDMSVFNADLKNRKLEKHVQYVRWEDGPAGHEDLGTFQYRWDGEGRLVEYASFNTGDTIPYENAKVQYLIAKKASDVYYQSGSGRRHDTVSYSYTRGGVIGSWKYRSVTPDSAHQQIGNYLYDSRGRVIVATNQTYGPLKGSYTYQYNDDGQLIRRTFNAGASGVVLCTDTIEYSHQAAWASILIANHKLKVAGMEKWVLLESRTYYPYTGVILYYSDYNDADSNYLYQNYEEYTVRYEYDDKGRLAGEYFGTIMQPDLFSAKYYYSKFNQPDSIVYSERVVTKKSTYTRRYCTDSRLYNPDGTIMWRGIITILYGEQKKSMKAPPKENVEIDYKWQ